MCEIWTFDGYNVCYISVIHKMKVEKSEETQWGWVVENVRGLGLVTRDKELKLWIAWMLRKRLAGVINDTAVSDTFLKHSNDLITHNTNLFYKTKLLYGNKF